jgi:hypothetical protein
LLMIKGVMILRWICSRLRKQRRTYMIGPARLDD